MANGTTTNCTSSVLNVAIPSWTRVHPLLHPRPPVATSLAKEMEMMMLGSRYSTVTRTANPVTSDFACPVVGVAPSQEDPARPELDAVNRFVKKQSRLWEGNGIGSALHVIRARNHLKIPVSSKEKMLRFVTPVIVFCLKMNFNRVSSRDHFCSFCTWCFADVWLWASTMFHVCIIGFI